jgi:gliding motility-associated-like protein
MSLTSGPIFINASLGSGLGTLAIGEVANYRATFTINNQAVTAGGVSNTATATATSPTGTMVSDISDDGDDSDGNTTNDPTLTIIGGTIENPSVEVTKTAFVSDNGDGVNGLGDTIIYTITVANTGDSILSNVNLNDSLTDLNGAIMSLTSGPIFINASLGSGLGTLAIGEVANYRATFTINNQAVTAGGVSNTATATATSPTGTMVSDISDDGDDSDGNTTNDPTITTTSSISESPSIEVTKSATINDNGDGVNGLGDTIIYTIRVANTGDTILSNVNLNDSLTDLNGAIMSLTNGPIFINASLGSGVGTLAIGEVATYRATFSINNQAVTAGGVSNTATATAMSPTGTMVSDISDDGDDSDGNTTNDPTITTTSSISESPSIEVTKSATINDNGDGVNGLGDTIIYTIRVANTGDTILSNVNLNDSLTDLNGAIMSLTNGPIFINASLGSGVGTLAIGEVATYRATFSINNQAVTAGGVSNTATATAMSPTGTMVSDISDDGDDSDGNMTNDPTITITNAVPPVNSSIEVTKTATISDNGNGATGLGDTITFLITVENTGTTTLNGLFIDDVFSDLSGNLLTLTTGPLFVSANIGSTEGSLIAGEIATYTATFVINAQADNAGGVSNTASATATDPTGNTVVDVSDDGDDKDGNTTNDPTVLVFSQNPIDGDFEVYTGMSPGDDGVNDYFKISGIEKYPNNKVSVFNRWGVLVYEAKGYGQGDRLFMGISEGRITITKNQKLPTGTYFYVIEFEEENPGRETYTGYLYINRD